MKRTSLTAILAFLVFPIALGACGSNQASPGGSPGHTSDGGTPSDGGPVPDGGSSRDACSLTTCASSHATCGSLANGCGRTLDCGTCPAPETCGSENACACTPATCTSLGADCGTLPNGCGATLSCGTCSSGETCGGGSAPNTCGHGSCTPTTCEAQHDDCGDISDGCGHVLHCGSCSSPEVCGGSGKANVCGCTPTTCAAEGATCGSISDGCGGTLDCGSTCPSGETCGGGGVANLCGRSAPSDGGGSCDLGSYAFATGPTYSTSSGSATLSRTIPWAPGIAGGIPSVTTVCKTLSATGHADDGPINSAIAACPANQVVMLNPGSYQITSPIMISSNVVLRGSGGPGAGSGVQTRLMADSSLVGTVVNIGPDLYPSPASTSANCTADALQGSSSVAVSTTTGFHVGDLVLVDILVDPADDTGSWILTAPSGGTGLVYPYVEYNPMKSPKGDASRGWFSRTNRPVSQMMEIKSIAGTTLTFSTPFHTTFDVKHAAQVTAFTYSSGGSTPTTNAGLEDLYVSGVPAPGGNNQFNNIVLTLAKYSWVKNVESDQSNGYSIGLDQSFRCIVRDSYMHSTINATPGGAGYGLEFSFGSADNLAENDISWNFNKVMVMRSGGGGNVIAYSYMDDGWIAYEPDWVESGMNADHMAGSHFELFEGNVTFSLDGDDTWGTSAFITWLRNVATAHRSAWPPLNTYTYDAKSGTPGCTSAGPSDFNCIAYTDYAPRHAAGNQYGHDFYNFVGNVLGYVGMPSAPQSGFAFDSTGPGWSGDPAPMWMLGYDDNASATDEGVVNTTFRDGNYDYATKSVHWNAKAQTLPDSLYLCSKPPFFGSYAWPWADGSNATLPYATHAFDYYALSSSLGTFGTSGSMTSFSGFGLPAFVRYLQLREVESTTSSCTSATPSTTTAACSLLVNGIAP